MPDSQDEIRPSNPLVALIKQLKSAKEPTMLVFAESHFHKPTHELLIDAFKECDIGFFEVPSKEQESSQKFRNRLMSDLRHRRDYSSSQEKLFYEVMLAPPEAHAIVDGEHPAMKKLLVTIHAIRRLEMDGDHKADPAFFDAVKTIYDKRGDDHLLTSNPHMAEEIARVLKKPWEEKQPIIAAALVGRAHVLPKEPSIRPYGLHHLLKEKGFAKTIAVSLIAVKPSSYKKGVLKEGEWQLMATNTQGIDYTFMVGDENRGVDFSSVLPDKSK